MNLPPAETDGETSKTLSLDASPSSPPLSSFSSLSTSSSSTLLPCQLSSSSSSEAAEDGKFGGERRDKHKDPALMQLLLSQLSSASTGVSLTAQTKTKDGREGTEKKNSKKKMKNKKSQTNAKRRTARRGGGESKEEEEEEGEIHREIERMMMDVQWEEGNEGEREGGEEKKEEELDLLLAPGREEKEGEEGAAMLHRKVTSILALLQGRKEENDRLENDVAAVARAYLAMGKKNELLRLRTDSFHEERRKREGLRERLVSINRLLAQRIKEFQETHPSFSSPPSSSSSSSSSSSCPVRPSDSDGQSPPEEGGKEGGKEGGGGDTDVATMRATFLKSVQHLKERVQEEERQNQCVADEIQRLEGHREQIALYKEGRDATERLLESKRKAAMATMQQTLASKQHQLQLHLKYFQSILQAEEIKKNECEKMEKELARITSMRVQVEQSLKDKAAYDSSNRTLFSELSSYHDRYVQIISSLHASTTDMATKTASSSDSLASLRSLLPSLLASNVKLEKEARRLQSARGEKIRLLQQLEERGKDGGRDEAVAKEEEG